MSLLISTASGTMTTQQWKTNKAINEYDERLSLYNNEYGEWVVVLAMEHGKGPFPVLNLGRDLPEISDFLVKLHRIDAKRRGYGYP